MPEIPRIDLHIRNMANRVRLLVIGNRILIAIVILIIIIIGGFLWMLAQLPEGIIARGVSISSLDVGGLPREQALKILESQTDSLENHGFNFAYKNISLNISSVYNPADNPELSREVYKYNPLDTVAMAYQVGRGGNNYQNYWERLWARFFGEKISVIYNLNTEQVKKILTQDLNTYENPAQDANLVAIYKGNNKFEITIAKEAGGRIFDYETSLAELNDHLSNLDPSLIILHLELKQSAVTPNQAAVLKPIFEKALNRGEIIFTYQEQNFKIPAKEWSNWIRVLPKSTGEMILGFNDKASGYLKDKIAPYVETPVQEAKFSMKDGKVEEFQAGEAGEKLDNDATLRLVDSALFGDSTTTINLVMKKIEPEIDIEKINDLGIKELVSVGKTNFRGSPVNRRHNIQVGAAALNGVLIAPGEEFSTIKRLSPIDDKNGYLPELVIKGNKTKPEFGGGLCQISTTLFRAVLSAGLPILERQNHAYRVPYYEPPIGVDATIYDPKPDFRFLNDTGHYLLLQTKIIGDDIIFEFWGTKDGRTIAQTEPKKFNPVPSPPAKLVETLDLPVGQKKCTEKAHAGIDAMFTYTVNYANGDKKTQDFFSHYKPWGEVCAIGVEKLSEPPTTADAITTPVISGAEAVITNATSTKP